MRQLNEDIRQQNFRQVYLLYGQERYLRRQYRDKLKGYWFPRATSQVGMLACT